LTLFECVLYVKMSKEYKKRTINPLLTLPNVKVSVYVHDQPVVLNLQPSSLYHHGGAYQFPLMYEAQRELAKNTQARLQQRDWRRLRSELINLEFDSDI